MACKSLFPLGQITRVGWQDKAIAPKSAHCTSCISTLLDLSLGSLCQAQRDEELFLLQSSVSDPRSGKNYSTLLQMYELQVLWKEL